MKRGRRITRGSTSRCFQKGQTHRVPCPQPLREKPPRVPCPQPPSKPNSPSALGKKRDVTEGLRNKSAGKWAKNNIGLSQTGNRCRRIRFFFASALDQRVFQRNSSTALLLDGNRAPTRGDSGNPIATSPTAPGHGKAGLQGPPRVGEAVGAAPRLGMSPPRLLVAAEDKTKPAEERRGGGSDPTLWEPLSRRVPRSPSALPRVLFEGRLGNNPPHRNRAPTRGS